MQVNAKEPGVIVTAMMKISVVDDHSKADVDLDGLGIDRLSAMMTWPRR
jgi:hypothetical protein